ncbi:MAG: hypothetical protein ONB46_17290 [candidate division KSB1 bacterium]|nr:hypothetical protein [candidate division KSB1 bacterium]MDZ7367409.1 hypothetical protein [candidate division KSB1 bacterium]MDZ7405486.1 hypothetical protein [candidate division KSB1 bacterium]
MPRFTNFYESGTPPSGCGQLICPTGVCSAMAETPTPQPDVWDGLDA